MPRTKDSAHLDLAQVFGRVQSQLLAGLAISSNFEHPTAAGTATEKIWLDLLAAYLPQRYHATSAFIINAQGDRSRQIDIAIYDALHCPPLFPHAAGAHIPIESVRAVFEVKPHFSNQFLKEAAEKAASVRALQSTTRPKILAGLLATTSVWQPATFRKNLSNSLTGLTATHSLTHGCAIEHGAFSRTGKRLSISSPDRALISFLLSLISQLPTKGPTPNLLEYLRNAA